MTYLHMSHLCDQLEAEEVREDLRDVVDDRRHAEQSWRTTDVLKQLNIGLVLVQLVG